MTINAPNDRASTIVMRLLGQTSKGLLVAVLAVGRGGLLARTLRALASSIPVNNLPSLTRR
jgi:hypothetical protein